MPSGFHSGELAQKFDDLGTHSRRVTTDSYEAQLWFDQGFAWLHGFNHDEAIRAFTKATELDPECAMAWWGIAFAHGPNYNDPMMDDARNIAAWAAITEAQRHADRASPVEKALIGALAARYFDPSVNVEAEDPRGGLDQLYADAMGRVWERFPDDPDVGALAAEARMNLRPWKLYDEVTREPKGNTSEIVAMLDEVLELDPNHPGALHLYIHAIEPSKRPEHALFAADRLMGMMPSSGHMQHMPSHIYVQSGDWAKAIISNQKAMQADRTYTAMQPLQGIQTGYRIHNAHMLAFAAMMSGREWEAMAAAKAQWELVPMEMIPMIGPFIDQWMCSVYDVQKRFGRWDDLLGEPMPPEGLPITLAVYHAHRAVAYAAKHEFDNARAELGLFRAAREALPEERRFGEFGADDMLAVSDLFIRGEIALQEGRNSQAIELLEEAIEAEDRLGYGEPPQWLQPTRHTLGALYLSIDEPAKAERVYRDDLAKWKENGWSLFGLMRALEEQGRAAEAEEVKARYREAWKFADERATTSCKCIDRT
ncbi:MAG: tetratricopeptide repeat protein [Planctomycetota bacterium]